MKISPVGAKVYRAGGQTGITKLTVAFRNFACARKNFIERSTSTAQATQKK
jgi:hypothetical protein